MEYVYDYQTGEILRLATEEEAEASSEAARQDGGAGVIILDGRACYVQAGLCLDRRAP